jgi:hypothetical protein
VYLAILEFVLGKLIGGAALLLLAAFMFAGFLGAEVASGAAKFLAFGIAVVLPGAAGAALIASHFRAKRGFVDRKEALRQQTLEAELVRLAGRHGAKLTIVEAVAELAVSPEQAKDALDALARRGLADFEVTESGVVVYAFHDVARLSEKQQAKGILE